MKYNKCFIASIFTLVFVVVGCVRGPQPHENEADLLEMEPPMTLETDTTIKTNEQEVDLRLLARDATSAVSASQTFSEVSVHDPSIIKVEDTYYIFGSHLASAKSTDLMHWTQVSSRPRPNVLFPNVDATLSEALEWAETDTFWAPDVIELNDGRFYFYYNACRGDSPLSAMGLAVSNHIEGPYEDLGIFLKSGMWGQTSPDGTIYDANRHPNVVDPHTFFDATGKLWMVYGSYSGGIFIMEMNPDTGFPVEGQGYGKKLLGGYHARIEGPYILYSPKTEYYYLFLSFGGLDSYGGYNIRVARSKSPDGPYLDSQGQDMIEAKGIASQIFHDPSYEPYGHKMIGNFLWTYEADEIALTTGGYVSPGHNSAYYEAETDAYYILFHTRFPFKGEGHQVRVHQLFFNQAGWPIMAPYRYAGETLKAVKEEQVVGTYKFIDHGMDISNDLKKSHLIALQPDGVIVGVSNSRWTLYEDYRLSLEVDGVTYEGVFVEQYDEDSQIMTMTFTVASELGHSIFGSMLYLKASK